MSITLGEESAPVAVANSGRVYVDTSNRPGYVDEAGVARIVGLTKVVRKTAETQAVNNSTVLVDDDALLFAIAANETYVADFHLDISTNIAAGFKAAITVPAGATLKFQVEILAAAAIGIVGSTTVSGTAVGATALIIQAHLHVCIVNGATAGNVQLQWAQNVVIVADTKVLVNSYLRAERLQ
jgi:hypothetical protein